jgi:hypothetical protein
VIFFILATMAPLRMRREEQGQLTSGKHIYEKDMATKKLFGFVSLRRLALDYRFISNSQRIWRVLKEWLPQNYTLLKNFNDFPVHGRDVTNQTLRARANG